MVGEEFGWVPLDGWTIALLVVEMLVVMMIPGFLLSLALFPKRVAMAMSERLALSFGLGLAPAFVLNLLNVSMGVRVNFLTSLMVFLFLCIAGVLGFLYRGGNMNLLEWWRSKGVAGS